MVSVNIIYQNFPRPRYGNIVARTEYGKIVTMIYSVFAIPLYVLYFRTIGKVKIECKCRYIHFNFKVFAKTFKWIYRNFNFWLKMRKVKNRENLRNIELVINEKEKTSVPTTACILVLILYIAIGKDTIQL